MLDHFKIEHFKLLRKWEGKRRNDADPSQSRAYQELKEAYELTEEWAKQVRLRLFPKGTVEVRKRPTNQANNFAGYNWAKIYPSPESPRELAYTVGIGADDGFVVKIDTVGLGDQDAKRRSYLALRGEYNNSSPIVAKLPAEVGLKKTFQELVEWSVNSIGSFKLGYDSVVEQIQVNENQSDSEILAHFQGKPAFRDFCATWSDDERALFCRLARIVHATSLDWWHVAINAEVRFGRRNPNSERAVGVLGTIPGTKSRTVKLRREIGTLKLYTPLPISDELVTQIDNSLKAERELFEEWSQTPHRPGLWPDQLSVESAVVDDEQNGHREEPEMPLAREPFNRIYYGPPGTGKTHTWQKLKSQYTDPETNEERYSFITFHQSYGYEEFVEGLRPVDLTGFF